MEAAKMDVRTIVIQGDEQVTAEIEGEVVMMSVQRGHYYGLDAVGSRIWKLIQEPRSVAALCDLLQEEFEVDRATCERDVLEFLARLAAERLIKVVDEVPG